MSDAPSAPLEPLRPDDPLASFVEAQRARRLDPAAKARIALRLGVGGGEPPPDTATPSPPVPAAPRVGWGAVALAALAVIGSLVLGSRLAMPHRDGLSDSRAAVVAVAPPAAANMPELQTGDGSREPAPAAVADPMPPSAPDAVEPHAPEARGAEPRSDFDARVPASSEARTTPRATARAVSELELLGRARAALATDPRASLALCAQHARAYPDGALKEEREVLAIDALVASGQAERARARARRFERAFPRSVHARHVAETVERAD